ncbi:MAG: carotenoid oxygenase family protein [Spirulinaceae cyanobacterium]
MLKTPETLSIQLIRVDAEKQQSFLLILDAQSLQELGRVALPHIIPLGFHGKYFAA